MNRATQTCSIIEPSEIWLDVNQGADRMRRLRELQEYASTAMASGVRLIRMGISGLAAPRPIQQTLFDDPQVEQQQKQRSLDRLTDAVQARFGAAVIKRARGVQAANDDD